jgi:hypothetical protein
MILFNQDVLFVHNPKTAGTSLLLYLEETLRPPVYRAGVKELGSNHPSLSLALGYACARMEVRPEDFKRIISVVRNPFAREISMYLYFRHVLNRSATVGEDLNDARIEMAVRMAGRLGFSEYLSWVWQRFGTCDIWHSRCFCRTAEGQTPENLAIVRTEHVETDIATVLAGIELQSHDSNLQSLNVSEHEASAVSFTDHARELVTLSYRWMLDEGLYRCELNS